MSRAYTTAPIQPRLYNRAHTTAPIQPCLHNRTEATAPVRPRLQSRDRQGAGEVQVQQMPIYNRPEILELRAQWKREGKTVAFSNGCYDILHPGHIRTLEAARSRADVLILALNTDASVARMKGPTRPVICQADRARMAASLASVDAVTFFDEDTPRELIAEVLPDVLVKGADWNHFVAGREEVEAAGGRVETVTLEPGFSTTNLVEAITRPT